MSLVVGDAVKVLRRTSDNTSGGLDWGKPNGDVGRIGYVASVSKTSSRPYEVQLREPDPILRGSYVGLFTEEELQLIKANSNPIMDSTTLISKFQLATKSEPDKTFIKAGVMNMDGSLTSEGEDLFLAYLIKEHGADFKKTVVDPIVSEEKETKKR